MALGLSLLAFGLFWLALALLIPDRREPQERLPRVIRPEVWRPRQPIRLSDRR